ncbi:MAG TPA: hypothetical protein VD886_09035 [Herpetosiphonaceae bacterium]|nr:hypothetical protein [Herpetosiphonaceae bacterium]
MQRIMRIVSLVMVAAILGCQAQPSAAQTEVGRRFPETGHTVQGAFLKYWEERGGLAVFGYPVSGELWEDGRVVQYFERNRLELHPENAAGEQVLLGLLGIERLRAAGRDWRSQAQGRPGAADCLFFPETGHSLCGEFRRFWEGNGGLPIFGYPITEPAPERSETDGATYTVQYFERNRMELHPENQAPHTVLLGLLGKWRADWLLGGQRGASPIRASLAGPDAPQSPLAGLSIRVDAGGFSGAAELRLFDGAGRREASLPLQLAGAPASVDWRAGGALGDHPAVLLIDGKVAAISGAAYRLDAQTQVTTGIGDYDTLVGKVREFLSHDISTYEHEGYTVRGYRSPDSYLIWMRDHIYQGLGYRYFDPDMTSALDYFRREQKPDGAFDDYFAIANNKPVQGRTEVEADLEYLFVLGVYQAWQASGDDAWLESNLEAMERGIAYSTGNPLRWNSERQLIRRPLTIDTWDFEYGGSMLSPDGKPAPRHWIDEKTRFGVMHGDNTGMAMAMRLMSRLSAADNDHAAASAWLSRADQLMERLNALAWNGTFFTHNVLEQPFDIPDVDDAAQLSLSNAYALNREVLSAQQARSIIGEYYRRRAANPDSPQSEWYSIDPPFPAGMFGTNPGWGEQPGEYVNGGKMPLVGGELARGAFRWGFEAYGFDILRRYAQLIAAQGGTYLWYYPAGNPGISGPETLATDGWGSTAMLAALMEGAAGILDNGALYRDVTISPRWTADAQVNRASVTARYAASLGYVAYDWRREERGLRLDLTGSGERATIRLLLPPEAPDSPSVTVNGAPTLAAVRAEGESRYLEFTLIDPTAAVAVSW